MGFQFNHVGGGTKTRRPITLHMKYNSACVQPNCFLVTEDYGEQELTLEELQVGAADHRPQTLEDHGPAGESGNRAVAKLVVGKRPSVHLAAPHRQGPAGRHEWWWSSHMAKLAMGQWP